MLKMQPSSFRELAGSSSIRFSSTQISAACECSLDSRQCMPSLSPLLTKVTRTFGNLSIALALIDYRDFYQNHSYCSAIIGESPIKL
jgi:hypothetical protein